MAGETQRQTGIDPLCMSAYLALRYVPWPDRAWKEGVAARLPQRQPRTLTQVSTADDIRHALVAQLSAYEGQPIGLLLSGGIDSAILAALAPKGTRAYTIRFVADGAIDESERAALFARLARLPHRVVDVTWDDYLEHRDPLMQHKQAPLHAIEVALHKAALVARQDGVRALVVGNGADSNFGGMDKLLSRDWSFDAFVQRYTFVDPARVLTQPCSMLPVFEPYRRSDPSHGFDVVRFLQEVHGPGIVQAFDNAIVAAGCHSLAPYEALQLATALDLQRIRAGEPKYLLNALFRSLYPDVPPPAKIAFARPMDQWLSKWSGPTRPELQGPSALSGLTGDQRWLVYCLDCFLQLIDSSPANATDSGRGPSGTT